MSDSPAAVARGVDGPVEPGAVARPPPAVLVVNDRANQRVTIRSMLGSLGVVVVEADSGRSALRAVFDQTFAVILMDVRMPGMDGYETADLIRQRRQSSETPIIFVTAYGREDHPDTVAAYASGAVDFLFTPVVPAVLRAKVTVFVDLYLKSEALQRSLDSITALNAALRDSEARTRAVLDNVADGIVTAGEGRLIESFSPAARALFGYTDPLTAIVRSTPSSRQPDLRRRGADFRSVRFDQRSLGEFQSQAVGRAAPGFGQLGDDLGEPLSHLVQPGPASGDEVIVRSIIDLAHNLSLTVVAEGVEDETALDMLVAHGCDNVQGYLLGRPSPIEDLNIWLTESPYGTEMAARR
jgi:CheY-like chemotaxis protein